MSEQAKFNPGPFVVQADEQVTWPLTNRNRYLIWHSVVWESMNIADNISERREGATWQDIVDNGRGWFQSYPECVHSQPLEWWEELARAATRLAEGLRTGVEATPHTIGEQAVLRVAGYDIESVGDVTNPEYDHLVAAEFAALPIHPDDLPYQFFSQSGNNPIWRYIQMGLTGDTDIEALWIPGLKPSVKDYSPSNWHAPFSRGN